LQVVGREEEAVAVLRRAVELDPVSLIINKEMGEALLNARHYDEALEQFKKTLEIDPSFFPPHTHIGIIYLQKRMYQEALAEFQKLRSIPGGEPSGLALVGYTYALTGKNNEARVALDELTELAKRKYVPAFCFAVIHVGLGDKDQAFAALIKACEERDNSPFLIRVLPIFNDLRSDPRYGEVLHCIGLSQ